MLEITTMVRAIPWSLTESAWPTTCCSTMGSTERWRSMYVELSNLGLCYLVVQRGSVPGCNQWLYLCCCSVHTKPVEKRWPSITVMITSGSCALSGQTTCQNTANRCRDVSFIWKPNKIFLFHYCFYMHLDWFRESRSYKAIYSLHSTFLE